MAAALRASSSQALSSGLGNGWREGEGEVIWVTCSGAKLAFRNRSKHTSPLSDKGARTGRQGCGVDLACSGKAVRQACILKKHFGSQAPCTAEHSPCPLSGSPGHCRLRPSVT